MREMQRMAEEAQAEADSLKDEIKGLRRFRSVSIR